MCVFVRLFLRVCDNPCVYVFVRIEKWSIVPTQLFLFDANACNQFDCFYLTQTLKCALKLAAVTTFVFAIIFAFIHVLVCLSVFTSLPLKQTSLLAFCACVHLFSCCYAKFAHAFN